MTKRDYELISGVIASCCGNPSCDPGTLGLVAEAFARSLAARSQGFDSARFIEACWGY